MVRYPVGVFAAYVVFLLLIRIWIWYVRTERGFDVDLLEGTNLDIDLPVGGHRPLRAALPAEASGKRWSLPGLDLDIDGEGLFIVVLFLVLVFAILVAWWT